MDDMPAVQPTGPATRNTGGVATDPPGDREKKAKLAYDEILALGAAQVEVMQAFRTRANVLLTIATGTAAILSFGDEVRTAGFPSARFFSFWAGVAGIVLAAFSVLALYLPLAWKENPGGVAGKRVTSGGRLSLVTGDFVREGPSEESAALEAIRDESVPYVEMLEYWGEFHRQNYRHNEEQLKRLGRLTQVAIVGVTLLVVAWLYNGYGLSDLPSTAERIIVEIDE